MKNDPLKAFYRIKNTFSWCVYDGKTVGQYKDDFDLIEKELNKHQKNRLPKREYYVKLIKYHIYEDKKYQDNCGFCIKDLNSSCLDHYFNNEYILVERMIVKHIPTNKVIYNGNDYAMYKDIINNL